MDVHRAEAMVLLRGTARDDGQGRPGTPEVGRGGDGSLLARHRAAGCSLQTHIRQWALLSQCPPGVALGPAAVGSEGSEGLQHLK